MAGPGKTAKAQQAPPAHGMSEGPPHSSTQRRYTGLGSTPYEDRTSPRPVTARIARLSPLLPEDTMAAHKTVPPIHPTSPPLPRFASTVDPQFLLPPYTSMEPPILSLPALNKKAFNAPTKQGPTQDMLDPSDKEVRQHEDIRPSGNLSHAPVSRQSKTFPRSGIRDGSRRPTRSPSSSPEIAQKTRAFRPAYSTEEQHFIWYLRIDRGYLWHDLLEAFNARFSRNGGRRELSGLQCRYYRLLGQYGIPQERMLRTADVVQRHGMRASLARAKCHVTYPWLSGQYPNNAYGQVLDGNYQQQTLEELQTRRSISVTGGDPLVYSQWNGQQLAKLAETYQRYRFKPPLEHVSLAYPVLIYPQTRTRVLEGNSRRSR